ncbi:MAG: hypothetical protein ACC657_07820 [Thiohalomonadales bacterium]
MNQFISRLIILIYLSTILLACSNDSNNITNTTSKKSCESLPVQVQIEHVIAGDGTVRIEWTCSKAINYNLYYSQNKNVSQNNGTLIKITNPEKVILRGNPTDSLFYTHKVQNNAFYYYVMTAVDSAGKETVVSRTVTAYPNKILITDKSTFTDKKLHTCILESTVSNNKFDFNDKWNYLTDITDLDCAKELIDLSGIEKLTNLQSITYSDINNINFNDSSYSYLSNVNYVSFYNIQSINLDGNTLLSMTGLDDIEINKSSLANSNWLDITNKNIRILRFTETQLDNTTLNKINNSQFQNLRSLYLEKTGRIDLNWLKTAKLGNLQRIYISDEIGLSDLTDINVSNLPSLRVITIKNIQIGNLDWLVNANFNNISSLRLQNIGLTNLTGIANVGFDKDYVYLDFSDNQLTSLSELFTSNINLLQISARNNQITSVNGISNFGDKLIDINLSGNNLNNFSDFQGSVFPELFSLSLGNNKFTNTTGFETKPTSSILRKFPKLTILELSTWPSQSNTGVPISDFSGVAKTGLNTLVRLAIDGSAISNFNSFVGANFANLIELSCVSCEVTSLDGLDQMGLNNLEQLNLMNLNKLSQGDQNVTFSGLVKANLSNLKQLWLDNGFNSNGFSDLSWFKTANLTSLESLDLYVTALNTINWMDPAQMASLKYLRITDVGTHTIVDKNYSEFGNVVTQLPAVKQLILYSINGAMDDLSWLNQNNGIQSLESLSISSLSLSSTTGLTNLNVPNLRWLDLSNNKLISAVEIANSGFTNLEEINLKDNSFSGANSVQALSVFTKAKKVRILPSSSISTSSISCADLDSLIAGLGQAVLDIETSIPGTNCVLP